ncbi:glycoside hydrolase 3 protein [Elasticomyces elasticus]|uniref:glucan 1,3-beta-glucosidase n=1 Tax=Exophiala sideris TaxID=1016849 RepID=A0ABR0IXH2_9EURO|nr:glycoside hydrolase 3 protein [Elasticomyces elasticus]KAK5021942.1 glycoside hydrolase 3 protein [Exophiala sideris]KAK5026005.1 glycoside hydrolase 3 protein [Exophiala sideris]KAK5050692.1 glycoside hydrolase 3 protein [Exophiala sideris]KAK5177177.1 glycoside hydrolase 3 protein [Eurotiomycetes sp. CCFEE 6388]
MHYRALLSVIILVAPLAVSAVGTLGFCLGNMNPDGSCKTTADFAADFTAIKANTDAKVVRTYSASDQDGHPCNTPSQILPAAKAAGMQVLLGIWPDGGGYTKEKAAIDAANPASFGDSFYGITVGSEGIYRGTYTVEDLIGWIQDVRKSYPNAQIGTADTWNGWANGSMDSIITSDINLVLANGFPYWQYQAISNATESYFDAMAQALGRVQEVSKGLNKLHFINGETGWPGTGGTAAGAAIAGDDNMKTYWQSAMCGLLDWGVDIFWFEAFDEPNKPDSTGDNGQVSSEQHWGAFSSGRIAKFDLHC